MNHRPSNRCFDTSCFSGKYVTGDIDAAFFAAQAAEVSYVSASRSLAAQLYMQIIHVASDPGHCAQRNDSALTLKNRKHIEGLAADGNDGALMNSPAFGR